MSVAQECINFSSKTIRELETVFNAMMPYDRLGRKKYITFQGILDLMESPVGTSDRMMNTIDTFLDKVSQEYDEHVLSEIMYCITKNLDNEFLLEYLILILSNRDFDIQSNTIIKLRWILRLSKSPLDTERALRHAGYICRYKIKEISDLLEKDIKCN